MLFNGQKIEKLDLFGRTVRNKKRTWFPKRCLYCGHYHQHNNAWCSAEHAKKWRAENPNQGRVFK
jgi:uncharacterized OB-fold protein